MMDPQSEEPKKQSSEGESPPPTDTKENSSDGQDVSLDEKVPSEQLNEKSEASNDKAKPSKIAQNLKNFEVLTKTVQEKRSSTRLESELKGVSAVRNKWKNLENLKENEDQTTPTPRKEKFQQDWPTSEASILSGALNARERWKEMEKGMEKEKEIEKEKGIEKERSQPQRSAEQIAKLRAKLFEAKDDDDEPDKIVPHRVATAGTVFQFLQQKQKKLREETINKTEIEKQTKRKNLPPPPQIPQTPPQISQTPPSTGLPSSLPQTKTKLTKEEKKVIQ